MQSINILFGKLESKNPEDEIKIGNSIKKQLSKNEYAEVAGIDFARNVSDITNLVATGAYDVLICTDELGDERVGSKTIVKWKTSCENLKIILLIDDEKKSGSKLYYLFRDAKYFDALYKSGVGQPLCELINQSRTESEAFEYYGMSNCSKYIEEQEKIETEQQESIELQNQLNDDINKLLNDELEDDFSLNNIMNSKSETPIPVNSSPVKEINNHAENSPYETLGGNQSMDTQFTNQYESNSQNMYNQAQNNMVQQPQMQPQMQSAPQAQYNYPQEAQTKNNSQSMFSVDVKNGFVVGTLSPTAIIVEVPGMNFMGNDAIDKGKMVTVVLPTK